MSDQLPSSHLIAVSLSNKPERKRYKRKGEKKKSSQGKSKSTDRSVFHGGEELQVRDPWWWSCSCEFLDDRFFSFSSILIHNYLIFFFVEHFPLPIVNFLWILGCSGTSFYDCDSMCVLIFNVYVDLNVFFFNFISNICGSLHFAATCVLQLFLDERLCDCNYKQP